MLVYAGWVEMAQSVEQAYGIVFSVATCSPVQYVDNL